MSKFSVGEIAILVSSNIPNDPEIGFEVEIVATPKPYVWRDQEGLLMDPEHYEIKTQSGLWQCLESALLKRRPPEQPADEDFQQDLNKWLKRDREVAA